MPHTWSAGSVYQHRSPRTCPMTWHSRLHGLSPEEHAVDVINKSLLRGSSKLWPCILRLEARENTLKVYLGPMYATADRVLCLRHDAGTLELDSPQTNMGIEIALSQCAGQPLVLQIDAIGQYLATAGRTPQEQDSLSICHDLMDSMLIAASRKGGFGDGLHPVPECVRGTSMIESVFAEKLVSKDPAVVRWARIFASMIGLEYVHDSYGTSSDFSFRVSLPCDPEFETWSRCQNTIRCFHGSDLCNWYSILRNGLQIRSYSDKMRNGAMLGEGVYMTTDINVALLFTKVRVYRLVSPS